jgi:cysteine desulfurase
MRRIYLDNNASTGLDPRVAKAMMDDLSGIPGNPSSVHYFGKEARKTLQQARETISECLHIKPAELVFNSGGTEGINTILRGFYALHPHCHIATSNVEHSCIYHTLQLLEKKGAKVTYLPAGLTGAVRLEQLVDLRPHLIILGSVNNETGVKTDIDAIADFAHHQNIPFVVDGVAHFGKEVFKIPLGVSAFVFSGHKFHGPKGVGAAFIRSSLKIEPLLTGGDQEHSKRAGTQNLSGILGLAEAVKLLKTELPAATEHMQKQRDRLIEGLMEACGNIVVHGQGPRICNTANIAFPGAEGESLLMRLDLAGISASHGSACSSGSLEPSRILLNMGIPSSVARTSLRFSLSRLTTPEEIETTLEIISKLLKSR